ncbi:MAG: hypothetical protein E7Z86_03990 [Methanosphaera stadtmanae]|nr:hypothetical protein [Methanosphaera stadtmanae]
MTGNSHPHDKFIENTTDIAPLVSLLDNSKTYYLQDNLSIHLHVSEIKLFKEIVKHDKPHHKKVRINQYKKLMENPDEIPKHFELHQQLFLKRYKKLERKGIIEVIDKPDNGLAYDFIITDKGLKLIDEMKKLESDWEEIVTEDIEDKEELLNLLKKISIPALKINYIHKKQQKGVY